MFASGKLTYSFIEDVHGFTLDPVTGVIAISNPIDRDDNKRNKIIYLTVRVVDNGKPVLDDVCTFKITVEDINDNEPFFDKVVSLALDFPR